MYSYLRQKVANVPKLTHAYSKWAPRLYQRTLLINVKIPHLRSLKPEKSTFSAFYVLLVVEIMFFRDLVKILS